ncbi:MAG: hypothetical protein ACOX68_01340 [Candidatus Limivicinus sp.]|jgi:hypothetical protein
MEKYYICRCHGDEAFLRCPIDDNGFKRLVPVIISADGDRIHEYITGTRFEMTYELGTGFHLPGSSLTYWFDAEVSPYCREITKAEAMSKLKIFLAVSRNSSACIRAFFDHFRGEDRIDHPC